MPNTTTLNFTSADNDLAYKLYQGLSAQGVSLAGMDVGEGAVNYTGKTCTDGVEDPNGDQDIDDDGDGYCEDFISCEDGEACRVTATTQTPTPFPEPMKPAATPAPKELISTATGSPVRWRNQSPVWEMSTFAVIWKGEAVAGTTSPRRRTAWV